MDTLSEVLVSELELELLELELELLVLELMLGFPGALSALSFGARAPWGPSRLASWLRDLLRCSLPARPSPSPRLD